MPKLPRRNSKKAFTLIELVIVVFLVIILVVLLIVAILAVFGGSKQKATEATMVTIGEGVINLLSSNVESYYMLTGETAGPFDPSISGSLGAGSGETSTGLPNSLSENAQRSQLLCLALSPSNEALESENGDVLNYDSPLSSSVTKGFITTEQHDASETFPLYLDAWENPISFRRDPDPTAVTENGNRTIQLVSAGPDGDFETEEDNIYWSTATKKTWRGEKRP